MGIGRENPVGESRGAGRANAQRAYADENVIHKMWIIAGAANPYRALLDRRYAFDFH